MYLIATVVQDSEHDGQPTAASPLVIVYVSLIAVQRPRPRRRAKFRWSNASATFETCSIDYLRAGHDDVQACPRSPPFLELNDRRAFGPETPGVTRHSLARTNNGK